MRHSILLLGFKLANSLWRPQLPKNAVVSPRPSGRATMVKGNARAMSVHDTKAEAVTIGRACAKHQLSELDVQNMDDRTSEKDGDGNDPRRTKESFPVTPKLAKEEGPLDGTTAATARSYNGSALPPAPTTGSWRRHQATRRL